MADFQVSIKTKIGNAENAVEIQFFLKLLLKEKKTKQNKKVWVDVLRGLHALMVSKSYLLLENTFNH